jgi:hypothetical protein
VLHLAAEPLTILSRTNRSVSQQETSDSEARDPNGVEKMWTGTGFDQSYTQIVLCARIGWKYEENP